MDDYEIPRGRTTSILLFSLLTSATFVIMKVPFLSQNSKYHISFMIIHCWQAILYTSAFVAMVLIIVLRNNRRHFMKTQVLSRKQYIIRCALFILFGLATSILPFYECNKIAGCFDIDDKVVHKITFTSYLTIGIYTSFHSIFAPLCYQYRCKSSRSRLLAVVILSANISLFGHSILMSIRGLNTEPGENKNKLPNNSSVYYFAHTLVLSLCTNGTEIIDRSITTQNVGKYTYPFLIELLFFSFTLMAPMWNILSYRKTHLVNEINADEPLTDDNMDNPAADDQAISGEPSEHAPEPHETQNLLSSGGSYLEMFASRRRWANTFKRASRFISQYSIIFSSIFVVTVFVVNIIVEVENDTRNPVRTSLFGTPSKKLKPYDYGFYYMHTIYTYITSIVPFIGHFIAKQQHQSVWRFDVDSIILFVCGCLHINLVIFETVDSITVLSSHPTTHLTEDVMYLIKILFQYVGIIFQIKFILRASSPYLNNHGSVPDQKVHVKGILIFLGICNFERFLAGSSMLPLVLRYANDIQGDDTFGHENWWFLARCFFPTVIFYRLWSALMCLKVYDMLKH